MIPHWGVVQQLLEELAGFEEWDISVDVLIIQLIENSCPELCIVDLQLKHCHGHFKEHHRLLAIENLDIFETDRHDYTVERIINVKVIVAKMLIKHVQVSISIPLDIILSDGERVPSAMQPIHCRWGQTESLPRFRQAPQLVYTVFGVA